MRITLETHGSHGASVGSQLAEILKLLQASTAREIKTMATLDDIIADVTAEKTLVASLGTFIQGLRDQLAAALAGAGLSNADQAKVDQVFTDLNLQNAAIAAAMAAGTTSPATLPTTGDAAPALVSPEEIKAADGSAVSTDQHG